MTSAIGQSFLERARQDARLSRDELWIRYFALGGMATSRELDNYLLGVSALSDHEHDVIAQALNEELTEQGKDSPVGYLRR